MVSSEVTSLSPRFCYILYIFTVYSLCWGVIVINIIFISLIRQVILPFLIVLPKFFSISLTYDRLSVWDVTLYVCLIFILLSYSMRRLLLIYSRPHQYSLFYFKFRLIMKFVTYRKILLFIFIYKLIVFSGFYVLRLCLSYLPSLYV